ncbi:MAG: T9SS type A sorting domain-containing protein [Flavobacteriaceae bacterium]|nr:T9SS type A sorting domain-containing protein [Flavobacteriaceae bacterium]
MKPIIIMCLISLFSFSISAQNSQRSSLGNSGSSIEITDSENTYYISQSIGQNSVTGTLINGDKVIRQGYQQPPTSVKVVADSNSDLEASVFPNPVDTFITVQFSEVLKNSINVVIYDISGKRILNTTENPIQSFNIDMSSFSSGVYLLTIVSGNKKYTAQLIKK